MAGRLYRMAKVVSANPKSWGIVDANEISGFKRVAKLSDLYSIAECILSSSYGDGVTDGADAVGQIWHVSETNGDYKLTNWASRKSAAGWTKLSYGGDVSVPVRDVHVNNLSVLSNGVAKIDLTPYAKTTTTDTLTNNVNGLQRELNNTNATVGALSGKVGTLESNIENIDTTVYEVIGNKALPTTGIKKRIYLKLIETGDPTGDNNKYAEYVYTGNIAPGSTYDATKWEKLGEVAAKTDLSEYYKKTEVYNKTEINSKVATLNNADIQNIQFKGVNEESADLTITLKNSTSFGLSNTTKMFCANSRFAGLMSSVDKGKLDGIAVGANKTIIDTAMSETSTNAVQNKVIDNAIKNHKINNNNIGGVVNISDDQTNILLYSGANKWIGYNDDSGACYRILSETTEEGPGIPKIGYSQYGDDITSYLLRDVDMVALTDTELTKILV